jgi:myogenesis-regulating glycosidase
VKTGMVWLSNGAGVVRHVVACRHVEPSGHDRTAMARLERQTATEKVGTIKDIFASNRLGSSRREGRRGNFGTCGVGKPFTSTTRIHSTAGKRPQIVDAATLTTGVTGMFLGDAFDAVTDETVTEVLVTVRDIGEGVSLRVDRRGVVTFFEKNSVISEGLVNLPDVCLGMTPSVVKKKSGDGAAEEALLRWGPKESPLALLHIHSHGTHEVHKWTQNMRRGFVLEFEIAKDLAKSEGAEISIRLEPSGHWFGGGHFIRQIWPLNDASLEVGPWYAFDNGPNGVNNLLGAHWMTSRGLLVSVDPSQQYLHIGMNAPSKNAAKRKWGVGIQNATRELLPLTKGHGRVARAGQDGLLRIQARSNYVDASMEHPLKHWQHEFHINDVDMLSVRMSMSVAKNAAEACRMALATMTPPKRTPDVSLFKHPIWTTWARYKTRVSQDKVLKYAQEIVDRGLPRSVMEIDDRWQVAYGDLQFDTKKFPDPVGMVNALHDMGFKVTTWVHPFVQRKSEAYTEGAEKGYFVGCDMADTHDHSQFSSALKSWDWLFGNVSSPVPFSKAPGGSKIGFFKWWNTPPVAALDVTNPEAVDWFVARLKKLQLETGVDGFKFDAGEPCFLPRMPRTHAPLSTPAEYTQLYVERVAGQFAGGVSEVRTGHSNHDVAIMYRMGDRFSTWDAANGLRSLIPTLLTSGVLGYPFCLPDMIGGNAYFNTFPDKELLVRWTQVNALMPAMQFSLAPWDLGRETERLVTKAISIRRKLEDHLVTLAEEAAETLTPICRPLWMIAPDEEDTYQIQDQFALGNDIIVAPVVCRGARSRDVYLTEGMWRDVVNGSVIEGGKWIKNVSSPLDHLPVYIRDDSSILTHIRW